MLRKIKRTGDDSFRINLPQEERELLRSLVPQLRSLIDDKDPVAWRLFPNAYQDDPEKAAQYEDMVGDDLRRKRLSALKTLETTVDEKTLTEAQLLAWMGAVNDLRLVLGTRLDVDEDSDYEDFTDDIDRSLFVAYMVLGWLMENIVGAL